MKTYINIDDKEKMLRPYGHFHRDGTALIFKRRDKGESLVWYSEELYVEFIDRIISTLKIK